MLGRYHVIISERIGFFDVSDPPVLAADSNAPSVPTMATKTSLLPEEVSVVPPKVAVPPK